MLSWPEPASADAIDGTPHFVIIIHKLLITLSPTIMEVENYPNLPETDPCFTSLIMGAKKHMHVPVNIYMYLLTVYNHNIMYYDICRCYIILIRFATYVP